jgi:transcriptional regulator with XRE-family HTH domain
VANTFRARLRLLRDMRRLTQREVAEQLGIAPSTLGMYEAGKREPDNDLLVAIAAIYETSTDYLLGLTDDPTPPSHDEGRAIRRDYPLPPIGYEDLSPEERERIDKLTREFERHTIELLLKEKREREEQQGR